MTEAIRLSTHGMDQGHGGPFGAVIVRRGKIIARGWNEVLKTNDPTAHAEVTAIRRASAKLKRWDLSDCEIYSSCEPCPMCLAAIYWARIGKLFFATTKEDAERIGFADQFIYEEFAKPKARRKLPICQFMRDKAISAFHAWQAKPDKTAY